MYIIRLTNLDAGDTYTGEEFHKMPPVCKQEAFFMMKNKMSSIEFMVTSIGRKQHLMIRIHFHQGICHRKYRRIIQ